MPTRYAVCSRMGASDVLALIPCVLAKNGIGDWPQWQPQRVEGGVDIGRQPGGRAGRPEDYEQPGNPGRKINSCLWQGRSQTRCERW